MITSNCYSFGFLFKAEGPLLASLIISIYSAVFIVIPVPIFGFVVLDLCISSLSLVDRPVVISDARKSLTSSLGIETGVKL